MTGQVVSLPSRKQREVGLTYDQLRTYLDQRGQTNPVGNPFIGELRIVKGGVRADG